MDLGSFSFLFSYQKNCGLFGIVRLLCRFNRVSLLCWCFLITRVSQVGPNLLWLLNGFLWPLCVRKWKTFKSSWVLDFWIQLPSKCVFSVCLWCLFACRVVVLESRPTDNPTAHSNLYILAGHENSYWDSPRSLNASWREQLVPPHTLRPPPPLWPGGEPCFISSSVHVKAETILIRQRSPLSTDCTLGEKKTKILLTLNLLWAETAARAKASQQTIPPSPLPPVFFFFSGPFIYCGMT